MRPTSKFRAAALALGLLAAPAFAVEFDAGSSPPAVAPLLADDGLVAPPLSADTAPAALDAAPARTPFGTAVAIESLDAMRGGDATTTTTTNRADLRGNVGGNTATNVLGAGNRVADGSFANAAGISTVIQNSGSNVLIQNSTIVNVQFVPTP